MSKLAVGVIGHNIVIDCGTHEEAMRLLESVRIDDGARFDDRLTAIVRRTAHMGLCSQTHHEHLMADARAALEPKP